jgi:hypothetical protein
MIRRAKNFSRSKLRHLLSNRGINGGGRVACRTITHQRPAATRARLGGALRVLFPSSILRNNRREHGDGRDRQSQFSDGLVSSPLQPLRCFVASDGAPASRDVRCESLDEAEPLEQLSKLDVVVGNGAKQQNQLEPAHSHRSSLYLVSRSISPARGRASFFSSAFCVPSGNGALECFDQLGDSREDRAVVRG